ncbi:MAG: hypothetical protein HY811_11095 [Planctomycetes bacterium]|nr:hypothetical protein [Planctomycetota bacterium]
MKQFRLLDIALGIIVLIGVVSTSAFARDYDPTTGRFTKRDPIEYTDDNGRLNVNLYTYVKNDPVNKTDPMGLFESGAPVVVPGPKVVGCSEKHKKIINQAVSDVLLKWLEITKCMRDNAKVLCPKTPQNILDGMIKNMENRLTNLSGGAEITCSDNWKCKLFGAFGYHNPIGGGGTIHICTGKTIDQGAPASDYTPHTIIHEFMHSVCAGTPELGGINPDCGCGGNLMNRCVNNYFHLALDPIKPCPELATIISPEAYEKPTLRKITKEKCPEHYDYRDEPQR